jgi:hypothetical protein
MGTADVSSCTPVVPAVFFIEVLHAYGSEFQWPHASEAAANSATVVHVDSGKENDCPQVNGVSIGPQARRLNDNDVVQLARMKIGFLES